MLSNFHSELKASHHPLSEFDIQRLNEIDDKIELKKAINYGNTGRFKIINEQHEGKLINAIIDKEKNTPLHIACLNCRIDLAKHLIRNGADINARNIYGDTPLMYAGLYLGVNGINKAVKLLIKKRVDPSIENIGVKTPFESVKSKLPCEKWGNLNMLEKYTTIWKSKFERMKYFKIIAPKSSIFNKIPSYLQKEISTYL